MQSPFALLLLATALLTSPLLPAPNPAPDIERTTLSTQAEFWWARAAADLNGDGILDLALQNNNARGGWLGWLEGSIDPTPWIVHRVADTAPDGQTFASGDLDAGDIDNDGDPDILGFAHPGEWDQGTAPTRIYWFENPSWTPHPIGSAPAFVKDANLADLNGDGQLDLVVITFEGNNLRIFRQDQPDRWTTVHSLTVPNLHEGMDVGDLDGDGDLDIAANGCWLENPGGDMSQPWTLRSIDDTRHSQTGDWSRNATKVACHDLNGDGRAEVFISHSERPDYPVAYYSTANPQTGPWIRHILLDNLPAAHTLQVGDANLDGFSDVLTGINRGRGQALGLSSWAVPLLFQSPASSSWNPVTLTDQGIYNGQIADVDADGDLDLFYLPSHDATALELWHNPTRLPGRRHRFTFEDSLPGQLPDGWRQGSTGSGTADWKIHPTPSGRVLAQTRGDNPNAHYNVTWLTNLTAKNLTLTVKLRAVAGQHDQGGGLVWRALDQRNYYVVRLNPLENNVVLYKMQDAQRADLPLVGRGRTYGMKTPALSRRWHTLAVDIHDDAFTVSLDGATLYQVRDTTFPDPGHIGLWTKADAVTWFDDLQIVEHR